MQNTGDLNARAEIVAMIEHALYDREGEWRVAIAGSKATPEWEMKIEGPQGFECTYALLAPINSSPMPSAAYCSGVFAELSVQSLAVQSTRIKTTRLQVSHEVFTMTVPRCRWALTSGNRVRVELYPVKHQSLCRRQ